MQFIKKCLRCGSPNNEPNYTCSCDSHKWTEEYRSVDVKSCPGRDDKARIKESYWEYSFKNRRGILQYYSLPFRKFINRINFPVGLTSFFFLDNLSKLYGTNVFIKNEGDNPSGCFKDRETLLAMLNSLDQGQQKAVIYSSGNAAASASLFASNYNFQLITAVAGDTYPEKVDYIREQGSDVIRIGDENTNFEEGYRLFSELNTKNIFNRYGFDNWSVRNPYRTLGDKTTAVEIIKQFSAYDKDDAAVPDFVIVPTGNGSCLAGLWKGFRELKELGIINKLPQMVSAAIEHASPIYESLQSKNTSTPAVCDLDQVDPEDMEIGSTILAEEGYDSIEATNAVLESHGEAIEVNKEDIQKALLEFLRQESGQAIKYCILPEPASLVTLAAIKKLKTRKQVNESSTVVAVISGHGAKAGEMIMELLDNHENLKSLVKYISANRKEKFKSLQTPNVKEKGRLITVRKDVREVIHAFKKLKQKDFGRSNPISV